MPDISQMTSQLRGLPDQALQGELQHPTGVVPSYLVLAEAQRRQLMRQAAQKEQGQSGTVMDDIMHSMMSGQPSQQGPPAPVGMTPPKQGQGPPAPGPMPGAQPPSQMGMARGGVLRFADGDLVEDDDTDTYQPPSQGSADRAMPEMDVGGWLDKYSKKYAVDPLLARTVMGAESGAQGQGAVSKKGAQGLFQLMPGTAKELGVDPNDPEQNVEGGIHYIRKMLDYYHGDLRKALAAYNAGPGTVDKYGDVPPYPETQNYVSSIEKKLKAGSPAVPALDPISLANNPAIGPRLLRGDQPAVPPPVTTTPPATTEQPVPQTTPVPEESEGDGEEDGTTEAAAPPAKTAAPSYVMPTAREFDPYNPANLDKQRQLYYTIFGGSPERQQQLEQQRASTVAQLQGLQQDAINRYRNQSPWEFLANIGAGMGESHQLSLPLMFAQGVGKAWAASDEQQNKALTQAETLQQHIDAIQNVGGTERERMGRDLVTLLGQQAKTPGGAAKFEDFVKMPGATYGAMDPKQAPPGKIGVPDPGHPGFGVWIDQDQATQAAKGQQLTGTFEKDYLPGWAEQNGTTIDKMTGTQRKQALKDFRVDQVDPSVKEAAQEIAKGIMEGTSPPDMKGLYRYGGQVRAILAKNGYNLATSALDWQNLSKFYAAQNGTQQIKMRQAAEQVSETLPNLRKLYQDWQATGLPGGFKMFNRAALVAAANLPGQQGATAQRLLTQIHDLTFELGNMYTGGNATTDKALQLAGQNLNADWNPETFDAALKQLETNVRIRRNSMRNVAPVGVSAAGQQRYMPQDGGAGQPDNTPPPRPAGIPSGAAAQWSPGRKQWRYKKPGSDTWEVLPPQ